MSRPWDPFAPPVADPVMIDAATAESATGDDTVETESDNGVTEGDLNELSLKELQALAEERGLKTYGTKAALIARIQE